MKVKKINIYKMRIPLSFGFKHSQHDQKHVESIFLILTLENRIKGYGECIPREYVTGENIETSVVEIERLSTDLAKVDFNNVKELVDYLGNISYAGAAQCALELAMLDAFSKSFKVSILEMVGRKILRKNVKVSGGFDAKMDEKLVGMLVKMKELGIKSYKGKVGFDDDIERVKKAKNILGEEAEIWLDTNKGWKVEEAKEMIERFKGYDIKYFEQPVKTKEEFLELKDLAPLMPDESLQTLEDANFFIENKACEGFSIRLSQVGGFLNALKIIELAEKNDIDIQIGANIGQSNLLTSASLLLASTVKNLKYFLGGDESFLFTDNANSSPLPFKKGGIIEVPESIYGFGQEFLSEFINKSSINLRTITLNP